MANTGAGSLSLDDTVDLAEAKNQTKWSVGATKNATTQTALKPAHPSQTSTLPFRVTQGGRE